MYNKKASVCVLFDVYNVRLLCVFNESKLLHSLNLDISIALCFITLCASTGSWHLADLEHNLTLLNFIG